MGKRKKVSTRRYIVAGAPCSGKSTFVGERAQRGDLIYDYDTLHQALSGQASHEHLYKIRPYVLKARDAIFDELEAQKRQAAWIITSTHRSAELRAMRDRFNAEVVLLVVDRDEAHRRCDADARPAAWHKYIDNWFDGSDIDPDEFKGKEEGRMSGQSTVSQVERRVFKAKVLRVVGGDKPRIVGYAAVFDQLSEDLGGFKEKIGRGAFSGAVVRDDVRALWQHDPNHVLGRTISKTLMLQEDDIGLRYEIFPPDTQWARDVLATMRRGDVDQSSFSFEAVREQWDESGSYPIRTLLEVKLYDVSPVTFPAYPQTSAQVRKKVRQFQRATATPGEVPHLAVAGDQDQAQARLDIRRRRVRLAELESLHKR